jgi:pimeloyl-ACP methyl ester carboxylesterase
MTGPLLYRVEEMMACWAKITAPVLWVEAAETDVWRWMGPKEEARVEIDRRIGFIANVQTEMMQDAGHMLHHDQPEKLARLIEDFLDEDFSTEKVAR